MDQGTRIAGSPTNEPAPAEYNVARDKAASVGRALYESPGFKGAVGAKDAQLQELYDFDKQMEASGNQSPTTGAAQQMYGQDFVPHYGDYMGGQGAAAGGIAKVAGASQGAVADTSKYYEDAMSSVMNKFLDFYKLRETQKDRELKQKNDRENRILDILSVTGGNYTNPDTGETHRFQTPEEKRRGSSSGIAQGEKKVIQDKRAAIVKVFADLPDGMKGDPEALNAVINSIIKQQPDMIDEVYDVVGQMFPEPESTKDTEMNTDLQDARNAIGQGANAGDVKRRFLEAYPTKSSLFDDYIYGT